MAEVTLDDSGSAAASGPTGRPFLTVVIPTRNRLPLLNRVLRTLDQQEDVEPGIFDVVVVVDGATDGTVEALRSMTTTFALTVIERPRGGVAGARNAGVMAARGQVVLFLDDDIIPSSRLVAEHLRVHAGAPSLVALGRFSPDLTVRRSAWTRYEELVQEKKYRALEKKHEQPSGIRFYSGNVSVTRRLFMATGGFDVGLARNEDVDLGFRLQAAGAQFVFIPEADGIHCGYHDLSAWLATSRLYGNLDAAIYRRRGYAGGLEAIIGCFHDRNPLNRASVRLALSGKRRQRAMVSIFCWIGLAAYALRFERISYAALSAVSNLQYWSGIRDGLRSNRAFWAIVAKTRVSSARPYYAENRR